MKALPLAVSVLMVAGPLLASTAEKEPKKNTATKSSTVSASAPTGDSPLVALARATGRLGKKPTNLITNETLVKTGGHLTTTKYITQLPPVTTEPDTKETAEAKALAARKAKEEAEEKAKKEEAAKAAATARRAAADYYGEDAETRIDDPAAQEHVMQQSTSTAAPQQTTTQKPPR
ncbi:MAG TPA: hypothetical protein VKH35_07125 [Thermoanaerobaculia bacterium]|nr:hypothetical protein [Thermoanaerobaculia bacterium]